MEMNNLEFLFFVHTYTYFISGYRIIPEIIVYLDNNIKLHWCNFWYLSSNNKWSSIYKCSAQRQATNIYIYMLKTLQNISRMIILLYMNFCIGTYWHRKLAIRSDKTSMQHFSQSVKPWTIIFVADVSKICYVLLSISITSKYNKVKRCALIIFYSIKRPKRISIVNHGSVFFVYALINCSVKENFSSTLY